MSAARFVLVLALLALPLAGCMTASDLVSLVRDQPDNRRPDPKDSYDPYGLVDRER
jgi:hypothetical protein